MTLEYAIQIDVTGDTTDSDSARGLVSGFFRWITGRPSFDGVTAFPDPAGDQDPGASVWHEGIITRGSLQPTSLTVDVVEAGDYANLGNFGHSIENASAFFNFLAVSGIRLPQKNAKVYAVIDGRFYAIWAGSVQSASWTDTEFDISYMDSFRRMHTTLPKSIITRQAFPGAPENVIGSPVPICLGRVTYADLHVIASSSGPIDIAKVSGVAHKVCAADQKSEETTGGGYNVLRLKTGEAGFQANELVGLVCLMVGSNTGVIIKSSAATDTSTQTTTVTLEQAFTDVVNVWTGAGQLDTSYFQVANLNLDGIVSELQISGFEEENGLPILRHYDVSAEEFVSDAELIAQPNGSSASNIAGTGYPGMRLFSRAVSMDGSVQKRVSIRPSSVKIAALDTADGATFTGELVTLQASGDEAVNLYNNSLTGYSMHVAIADGSGVDPTAIEIRLDVVIPDFALKASFSALYVLVDYTVTINDAISGTNDGAYMRQANYGRDLYGRTTNQITGQVAVGFDDNLVSAGTTFEVRNIPKAHYGLTGSDAGFSTHKAKLDVASLVEDPTSKQAYPTVRAVLRGVFQRWVNSSLNDLDITINEVAIVGETTVNVVSEQMLTKVRGEVFPDSWGGRRTAGALIENLPDVLEHMIRDHEEAGDDLDAASFDALAGAGGARATWYIGRQLTQRQDSIRTCLELCRHGFVGLVPKRGGTKALKAWRENLTSVYTFDSSNILGFAGPVRSTELERVYNDLAVRYEKNPATGAYRKSLFVTRVDEISFPGPTDTSVQSTVPLRATNSYMVFPFFYSILMWVYLPPGTVPVGTHKPGEYYSMSGTEGGGVMDFPMRQLAYEAEDSANPGFVEYLLFGWDGPVPDPSTGTSGTLTYHGAGVLKWPLYVGGVDSYATAEYLWNLCHESYGRIGMVRPLPDELANCDWFIDPKEWFDAPGEHEDAALQYLINLAEWTAFEKELVSFRVGLNAATASLELLDYCTLNDPIRTLSANRSGWVVGLKVDPGAAEVEVTMLFDAVSVPRTDLIIETGDAPDTITESGAQPDTITEGA